MQLFCPTCGEQVKAESVNVQDMVAVCSACDSVFKFSVAEPKTKRRKVSQPLHLSMRDDDTLHMAFRTNFRLDKDESFIMSSIMGVAFTIITLLTFGDFLAGDLTGLLPLAFGSVAAFLYYWLGTIVFNKTHIDMDDESIQISRQPLPTIFSQTRDINLSGMVSVYSEETAISKKEAYDTPRYHVWAEMADGNRKIIVADVLDDYAVFIAQRLNQRLELEMETDVDVSRLAEIGQIQHDHHINEGIDPPQSLSQNHSET